MNQPEADPRDEPPRQAGGLRRWRWPLILGGPAVILLAVVVVLLTTGRFQSTDNAYVQIAKTPVAPSINGRVTEILVRENQAVRRGDVLFRMDSEDLKANLAAAEAKLASAELEVRQQRAAYSRETANVAVAGEAAAHAAREAERQGKLVTAGVSSRQQADEAAHLARQTRDQLAAARQQAAEALAVLGGDPEVGDRAPAVLAAKANVQLAKLRLSYATVTAPADGIVARVDQMPIGAYLNASQTAFWLLAGRPWVEANFKEDQLERMRVGQRAEIEIDAFPDTELKGRVGSFAPGTGSAFSVLPAQNATGNWVKVTQRLPVRIEFDKPPPALLARAGLSAKVKVDVRTPAR